MKYLLLRSKHELLYFLVLKFKYDLGDDIRVLSFWKLNDFELELLKNYKIEKISLLSWLKLIFKSNQIIISDKRSLPYHVLYNFSFAKFFYVLPDGFSDLIDGLGSKPIFSPFLTKKKLFFFKGINFIGSFIRQNKKIILLDLCDFKKFYKSKCQFISTSDFNVFVGQPLSEIGVLSLKDELLFFTSIISRVGKLVYFVHPKENVDKFQDFSSSIEFVKYSIPFELNLIQLFEMPQNIYGFYSTTLINIKEVIGDKIKIVSFDVTNSVLKPYVEEVKSCYKVLNDKSIEVIKI